MMISAKKNNNQISKYFFNQFFAIFFMNW